MADARISELPAASAATDGDTFPLVQEGVTKKLTWANLKTTLGAVLSDTTGVTGADQVTNIISLTQAEYDAIGSPSATTLYVITG